MTRTCRLRIVLVATVSIGPAIAQERVHEATCDPSVDCGDKALFGDTFRWQEEGPLKFLESIRVTEPTYNHPVTPYVVLERHHGWITAADVPELITLVESNERCAAIVYLPEDERGPLVSTIGHEAQYLIAGFRAGVYPPRGLSTNWREDLADTRRWFSEFIQRGTESN